MPTIQQAIHQACQQLISAGQTDTPKLDAELLLAFALQKSRTYLFTWPDQPLEAPQSAAFSDLLAQRLQGHPIAHITGQREFWGLNLKVTPDTLIPRPDTETLVEAVLSRIQPQNATEACTILDLGTGSGAIALALKSELPQCQVIAIDQSSSALAVAQQNAQTHQLAITFLHSNWFSVFKDSASGSAQLPARFDFIVSNPPYIEAADTHLTQGDVRFEPLSALTSGEDGLEDIRLITDQAWSYLKPSAWLFIEHGYNQAQRVHDIFRTKGYESIELFNDLGGNPRITAGQKPATTP